MMRSPGTAGWVVPRRKGIFPLADYHHGAAVLAIGQPALETVRLADELGHKGGERLVIDAARLVTLLDRSGPHDRNAIRHAERLLLIMGDEDCRHPETPLQPAQLHLHRFPELGIKGAEGLVEEKRFWSGDERARQSDPLLLPAGQLSRVAPFVADHLHEPECLLDAPPGLGAAHPAHLEAEADILADIHVREERIALEDHAEVTLVHGHPGDGLTINEDLPARRRDEPRDAAQKRRLSAAGRPQERDELACCDRQVDALQGVHRPEASAQAPDLDIGVPHAAPDAFA